MAAGGVAGAGVLLGRALGPRRAAAVAAFTGACTAGALLLQERRLRAVAKTLDRRAGLAYREAEDLVRLSALLGGSTPLPRLREGAVSPDLAAVLVRLVRERTPQLIVELGSGSSTVVLAAALRAAGIDGRIVAIEHDQAYVAHTVGLLADAGLTDLVEVRHAPLEPFPGDPDVAWYRTAVFDDLAGVGLVFIDGPPAFIDGRARRPALPFLVPFLDEGAALVLDDADRPGERAALTAWTEAVPGLVVEAVSGTEKGAVVLCLPASG